MYKLITAFVVIIGMVAPSSALAARHLRPHHPFHDECQPHGCILVAA